MLTNPGGLRLESAGLEPGRARMGLRACFICSASRPHAVPTVETHIHREVVVFVDALSSPLAEAMALELLHSSVVTAQNLLLWGLASPSMSVH